MESYDRLFLIFCVCGIGCALSGVLGISPAIQGSLFIGTIIAICASHIAKELNEIKEKMKP